MKTLFVNPDGTIRAVVSRELLTLAGELGNVTTRRASHVLPVHPAKRAAFRLLRAVFSERGRIAEWCRQWQGPWQVRFASDPGKVVFTHQSRRVCIDWEVRQLNERLAAIRN